jgi:hypothetical protein
MSDLQPPRHISTLPILLKKSVDRADLIFLASQTRIFKEDVEGTLWELDATRIALNGIAVPSIVDPNVDGI